MGNDQGYSCRRRHSRFTVDQRHFAEGAATSNDPYNLFVAVFCFADLEAARLHHMGDVTRTALPEYGCVFRNGLELKGP